MVAHKQGFYLLLLACEIGFRILVSRLFMLCKRWAFIFRVWQCPNLIVNAWLGFYK